MTKQGDKEDKVQAKILNEIKQRTKKGKKMHSVIQERRLIFV